jgi:hypothetical protein
VGTLFTNPIVKRVGAHKWIPILMNSWAIVTWAHALIHVSYIYVYAYVHIKFYNIFIDK